MGGQGLGLGGRSLYFTDAQLSLPGQEIEDLDAGRVGERAEEVCLLGISYIRLPDSVAQLAYPLRGGQPFTCRPALHGPLDPPQELFRSVVVTVCLRHSIDISTYVCI